MREFFESGQWRLAFCILLGIAALFTLIMQWLGYRLWRLKAEGPMKISIIDLEFPSTPEDLPRMLAGILRMDVWLHTQGRPAQSAAALRGIEYADFFFMPGAYGAIALLSLAIAHTFGWQTLGGIFFQIVAFAQGLAWLCDVFENILTLRYLNKVKDELDKDLADKRARTLIPKASSRTFPEPSRLEKPKRRFPTPMPKALFKTFTLAVWTKWVLALLGLSASMMLTFYFWLKGDYDPSSLPYLGIASAEVFLFLWAGQWLKKRAEAAEAKTSSPSPLPQA